MKPKLYLEGDLFSEDTDADTKGVISKYFDVVPIDLHWALENRTKEIPSPQLRASLEVARIFKRKYQYANAMNWMSALREYTLTPRETVFTDLAHIRKYWLQHQFYDTFIRPCDGFKAFSGQVFGTREKFIIEHDFMVKGKNIDPYLMCMVSPVKSIDTEFRCVFINGEYVSGSQYMKKGQLSVDSAMPDDVILFAKKLAEHEFFLNRFEFVIDIGLIKDATTHSLHLIEVNAFETASFYKADLDLIYSTLAALCKH